MFIAEDTGGAINGGKIDIAVSSHEQAYAMGISMPTSICSAKQDRSVQRPCVAWSFSVPRFYAANHSRFSHLHPSAGFAMIRGQRM